MALPEGGCAVRPRLARRGRPALKEGVYCFREKPRGGRRDRGPRGRAGPRRSRNGAGEQVRSGVAEIVVVTEGAEGALS